MQRQRLPLRCSGISAIVRPGVWRPSESSDMTTAEQTTMTRSGGAPQPPGSGERAGQCLAQCLRGDGAESALGGGVVGIHTFASYFQLENRVGTCSGRVIDVSEVRAGRFGVIRRRNEVDALEGWSRTSKIVT